MIFKVQNHHHHHHTINWLAHLSTQSQYHVVRLPHTDAVSYGSAYAFRGSCVWTLNKNVSQTSIHPL